MELGTNADERRFSVDITEPTKNWARLPENGQFTERSKGRCQQTSKMWLIGEFPKLSTLWLENSIYSAIVFTDLGWKKINPNVCVAVGELILVIQNKWIMVIWTRLGRLLGPLNSSKKPYLLYLLHSAYSNVWPCHPNVRAKTAFRPQ